MTKKIIALTAAMAIVFGSVGSMPISNYTGIKPITATAVTSGDWEYELLMNDTLEIKRYLGNSTDVTIPAYINGKKVYSLGYDPTLDIGVFSHTNVIKVRIPYTVESIGYGTFDWATDLTEIIVDNNNESYSSKNGLLYDKEGLVLYDCPEGKTGTITLPSGLLQIQYRSFSHCRGIDTVNLPDSVKSLEALAFYDCSLKSINIHAGVTYINDSAFGQTPFLNDISLDPNNQYYEYVDGVLYLKNPELVYALEELYKIIYISPNAMTLHLNNETFFSGSVDEYICGMQYSGTGLDNYYPGNTNGYSAPYATDNTDRASLYNYPLKISNIIIENSDDGIIINKLINGLLYQRDGNPAHPYKLTYIPYDKSSIKIEPEKSVIDHSIFENRPNLRKVVFADDDIMPEAGSTEERIWLNRERDFPLNVRLCCNENSTAAEFFRRNHITYYPIDSVEPGDITGDGNVNMRDLATLQRYINGWDVQVDETTADVNKDGSVNMRDYALVQRFINDWDVELK